MLDIKNPKAGKYIAKCTAYDYAGKVVVKRGEMREFTDTAYGVALVVPGGRPRHWNCPESFSVVFGAAP